VDDENVEDDPEEETVEQNSNDFKTASKRANVAEQLKVGYVHSYILYRNQCTLEFYLGEFSPLK
jgi:hypothetical protein